jgi:tetratricopeptide (TPR) repeat protein
MCLRGNGLTGWVEWSMARAVPVALLCVLAVLPAAAEFPEESLPALETAKQKVAEGQWDEAIDAYAEHLGKLTTRDFRDKKTFNWILDAYEKAAPEGKPDYQPFWKIVERKLPRDRSKADPVVTWRLHMVLAEIALRVKDSSEAAKQLELAIDRYPDVAYSEPDTQSRLQHLYNTAAFLKAEKKVEDGEDYLVKSLREDPRFVYPYLRPWREFYAEAGTPERFAGLLERILEAYDAKIKEADSDRADTLAHYRRLIAEEAEQP